MHEVNFWYYLWLCKNSQGCVPKCGLDGAINPSPNLREKCARVWPTREWTLAVSSFGLLASCSAIRPHGLFLGSRRLCFQISHKNRTGTLSMKEGFHCPLGGKDLQHLFGQDKQPLLKVKPGFCVTCTNRIVKNIYVFQLFCFFLGGGILCFKCAQNWLV